MKPRNPKAQEERPKSSFDLGRYVVVDKPLKWTSFDVVNKFRYLLSKALGVKRIKVGHAGTLDPLATGVVVICTGKATKTIDEVQRQKKHYRATIKLGETTPSFDLESEPDGFYPTEHITKEMVEETLRRFEGEVDQVPPLFSAVNVGGTRAYKLARKGEERELQPRKVFIERIELTRCELPEIDIEVTCSKGTYIRALARDIGKELGSGAHLTSLRRTKVGSFSMESAIKTDEMEDFIHSELAKEGYNYRDEQKRGNGSYTRGYEDTKE